jgi:uncharacterized membrane protein YccC
LEQSEKAKVTDERLRHRARHRGAWKAFVVAVHEMPPAERLRQGTLMAVQATCSASLAYGIGRLLHTHDAFWAAMTGISVVQHSYVDTEHLARDQLIGALVGGLCGLIASLYGGGHYLAYAATIAVAVIVSWAINIGSAARLAATTATIVLLVPAQGSPWQTAATRFGEVAIGTLSALLVCVLLSTYEKWRLTKSARDIPQ